jgi:hypothetical protein
MVDERCPGVAIPVIHVLGGRIAPPYRRKDPFPGCRGLRRHKAVFSRGISAIGDPPEVINAPEQKPLYLPITGGGNGNIVAHKELLFVIGMGGILPGNGTRRKR